MSNSVTVLRPSTFQCNLDVRCAFFCKCYLRTASALTSVSNRMTLGISLTTVAVVTLGLGTMVSTLLSHLGVGNKKMFLDASRCRNERF